MHKRYCQNAHGKHHHVIVHQNRAELGCHRWLQGGLVCCCLKALEMEIALIVDGSPAIGAGDVCVVERQARGMAVDELDREATVNFSDPQRCACLFGETCKLHKDEEDHSFPFNCIYLVL